jgi:hypothetical protein
VSPGHERGRPGKGDQSSSNSSSASTVSQVASSVEAPAAGGRAPEGVPHGAEHTHRAA